jgi:cytochrome c
MSRNLFASAFAALVLSYCSGLAAAQQSGTAAEAKAMFDRAVAAVKADEATALGEFNDKNNKQFHDRDLYVFCFNMSDGKLTADADQAEAVMGVDIRTLKFKDDPFGKRQYDATKAAPEGSVTTEDYDFPKPGTSVSVPKESYMTRVGDQGCGVGYYK